MIIYGNNRTSTENFRNVRPPSSRVVVWLRLFIVTSAWTLQIDFSKFGFIYFHESISNKSDTKSTRAVYSVFKSFIFQSFQLRIKK